MAGKKTLRRQPRQARGERRIGRILDAAALLFGRVGYEAATTNAIARQAKTSIGSLYQFFPNKEAILEALVSHYEAQLRAVHDRVLNAETADLPLPDIYERVIGTLAEFHAAHPGFWPLFYGSTTSPALSSAAARLHQECIGRVEAMLARRHPELPPSRRRLLATINVEVIKALLPLAEEEDEAYRAEVIAEMKNLLLAHMRQAVGTEEGLPRSQPRVRPSAGR
jgi:AcrR family transcriptional regulator